MNPHYFQLTVSHQDDYSCPQADELYATLLDHTGGKLVQIWGNGHWIDFKQGIRYHIPNKIGVTPPTWYIQLLDGDPGLEEASFNIRIDEGLKGKNPTDIPIHGSDMQGWVKQNEHKKTRQIYKHGGCGIFGLAQENIVGPPGNTTFWIYTVTGGVNNPKPT
ncbi:MAG: hypothetical protein AAF629_26855 [Chloroflexota bacterium]